MVLLPSCAFADDAVIGAMAGRVDMRLELRKGWEPAIVGAAIPEGGGVRTGEDGAAELRFPNKSKIWLKPNSTIEIEQHQSLAAKIAVVAGYIKARVPHLKRKEVFELRTTAAVAAVRGTELLLNVGDEGAAEISVLYGLVQLAYNVPPAVGPSEVDITQGVFYRFGSATQAARSSLLTPDQELEGLRDWTPGLSRLQTLAMLKSKETDRQLMRVYARTAGQVEQVVDELVNHVRDEDMAAGRTLTDVSGNLVRVDQRLLRPDAHTIQLVNMVKRPVYDYTYPGRQFAYNGGTVVNRLDSLQARVEFNKDLPANITEWSGFFQSDSVRADRATVVSANQTDASNIYAIGFIAVNPQSSNPYASNKLDDGGQFYFGTVDLAGYNALANGKGLTLLTSGAVYNPAGVQIAGLAWAQKDSSRSMITGSGDPVLSYYSAMPYCIGGDCSLTQNQIWFAQENYIIGNGGNVRLKSDITDSTGDVMSIFKDNAGQAVFYVKNNQSGTGLGQISSVDTNLAMGLRANGSTAYLNPAHTNADIVLIPDIGVSLIATNLSMLDKIVK